MRVENWNVLGRWAAVMAGVATLACMDGNQRQYTPDPEAVRKYQREKEMEDRREKYGDTVQFEFVKPEGAKYKIDGRDYPVPARVGLRVRDDRSYPIQLRTQDGGLFVGEIEVKLTNAGTKMGLVTVKEIDDDKLKKEVSKGQPLHVNFVFLNEVVAELRLGNRPELDERGVLIVFPGVLKEVEMLRDEARNMADEWTLWKAIFGAEDTKGIDDAKKLFADGMRMASDGSADAATAFDGAIKAYENEIKLARKKINDTESLDAARESANDAMDAWDRWMNAWMPKETPDEINKAFEAIQKAEALAREEGKAGEAAKAYESAATSYRDGLKKAREGMKEQKMDCAGAEAKAWLEAWEKWSKDASAQPPAEIKVAEEAMKKAEDFAAKKDEKRASWQFGIARDSYCKAFDRAKQTARDAKQLGRARTAAEKYAEAWGNWMQGKNAAESDDIRKAKEARQAGQTSEAAGKAAEAAKAYWDAAERYSAELKREKMKGKEQQYDSAIITVDRRNSKVEPPEFVLRQQTGSYSGTIKFEAKTYYLSLSVPNVTEFTRVSKIVIWNITRRTLNQVSGGKPVILTYDLAGTKVLELAIGNRE